MAAVKRRVYFDEESDLDFRDRKLVPREDGALLREYRRWLAAVRWRHRVERALMEAELTFPQWSVLQAMSWLIDETGDAVSQRDVARELESDRATISLLMRRLEARALVDRDCGANWPTLRIWLPRAAEELLARVQQALEAASEQSEREREPAHRKRELRPGEPGG